MVEDDAHAKTETENVQLHQQHASTLALSEQIRDNAQTEHSLRINMQHSTLINTVPLAQERLHNSAQKPVIDVDNPADTNREEPVIDETSLVDDDNSKAKGERIYHCIDKNKSECSCKGRPQPKRKHIRD